MDSLSNSSLVCLVCLAPRPQQSQLRIDFWCSLCRGTLAACLAQGKRTAPGASALESGSSGSHCWAPGHALTTCWLGLALAGSCQSCNCPCCYPKSDPYLSMGWPMFENSCGLFLTVVCALTSESQAWEDVFGRPFACCSCSRILGMQRRYPWAVRVVLLYLEVLGVDSPIFLLSAKRSGIFDFLLDTVIETL